MRQTSIWMRKWLQRLGQQLALEHHSSFGDFKSRTLTFDCHFSFSVSWSKTKMLCHVSRMCDRHNALRKVLNEIVWFEQPNSTRDTPIFLPTHIFASADTEHGSFCLICLKMNANMFLSQPTSSRLFCHLPHGLSSSTSLSSSDSSPLSGFSWLLFSGGSDPALLFAIMWLISTN